MNLILLTMFHHPEYFFLLATENSFQKLGVILNTKDLMTFKKAAMFKSVWLVVKATRT